MPIMERLGGRERWGRLRRVVNRVRHHRLMGLSAEIAFYELVAFFPFLILCLTVIGFLPIAGLVQEGLNILSALGPPQAVTVLGTWIERAQSRSPLSLMSFGAMVTLWLGSAGVASYHRAFGLLNDEDQPTSFWMRVGVRLLFTALGAVALTLLLLFWVVWPILLHQMTAEGWMEGGSSVSWLVVGLGRFAGFLVVVAALVVWYGVLSPRRGSWRSHVPGALLATGLLWMFSAFLSFYFRHVGTVNTIYGGLASLMVLMVWLQTINVSVLMGESWNVERGQEGAEGPPRTWKPRSRPQ